MSLPLGYITKQTPQYLWVGTAAWMLLLLALVHRGYVWESNPQFYLRPDDPTEFHPLADADPLLPEMASALGSSLPSHLPWYRCDLDKIRVWLETPQTSQTSRRDTVSLTWCITSPEGVQHCRSSSSDSSPLVKGLDCDFELATDQEAASCSFRSDDFCSAKQTWAEISVLSDGSLPVVQPLPVLLSPSIRTSTCFDAYVRLAEKLKHNDTLAFLLTADKSLMLESEGVERCWIQVGLPEMALWNRRNLLSRLYDENLDPKTLETWLLRLIPLKNRAGNQPLSVLESISLQAGLPVPVGEDHVIRESEVLRVAADTARRLGHYDWADSYLARSSYLVEALPEYPLLSARQNLAFAERALATHQLDDALAHATTCDSLAKQAHSVFTRTSCLEKLADAWAGLGLPERSVAALYQILEPLLPSAAGPGLSIYKLMSRPAVTFSFVAETLAQLGGVAGGDAQRQLNNLAASVGPLTERVAGEPTACSEPPPQSLDLPTYDEAPALKRLQLPNRLSVAFSLLSIQLACAEDKERPGMPAELILAYTEAMNLALVLFQHFPEATEAQTTILALVESLHQQLSQLDRKLPGKILAQAAVLDAVVALSAGHQDEARTKLNQLRQLTISADALRWAVPDATLARLEAKAWQNVAPGRSEALVVEAASDLLAEAVASPVAGQTLNLLLQQTELLEARRMLARNPGAYLQVFQQLNPPPCGKMRHISPNELRMRWDVDDRLSQLRRERSGASRVRQAQISREMKRLTQKRLMYLTQGGGCEPSQSLPPRLSLGTLQDHLPADTELWTLAAGQSELVLYRFSRTRPPLLTRMAYPLRDFRAMLLPLQAETAPSTEALKALEVLRPLLTAGDGRPLPARVLFYPDSSVRGLPLELIPLALPQSPTAVLGDHLVALTYVDRLADRSLSGGSEASPASVLVLADPQAGSDRALPIVQAGAGKLLHQTGGLKIDLRLGAGASAKVWEQQAPSTSLAFLMMHGECRPNDPLGCGLSFSDRNLSADELARIALPKRPDVIMLACQSGAGGSTGASLVRALRTAGARTVIASRWKLDETRAVALAKALLPQLARGVSVAEALQGALRETSSQQDPAARGALYLVGDL